MADTTIDLNTVTDLDLYTQINNKDNQTIWNGTSLVSFANINWSLYATATDESPAGSGRYSCQMPSGLPAGNYSWTIFLKSGADPALGDPVFANGSAYWNGTSFVSNGGEVILAANGMDNIILEDQTDTTPQINMRQGVALMFNSAPGGLISGVQSTGPIVVKNPDGAITRMTIQADPKGNRLQVTFNNLP